MVWTLWQYRKVADTMHDAVDADTQFTIGHRLGTLLEKGNTCGPPISKHLRDGIFELRAKRVRLLFYFGNKQQIVFVHGIDKKTMKVPPEDIELAIKRRGRIT